jgi:TolB-like protein/cytochrome c-type biogenesis protein CcmH/NrfG
VPNETKTQYFLRQLSRRRSRKWLVLAAAVVVLAGGVLFLSRTSAEPIDRSIAVLPFENLSTSKENAFLAGGIHENIVANLSKISDLRVVSRASVTQVGKRLHSGRECRKLLNVGTMLEGSVRREGDRIRVNVQLVDTRNDRHIWAETYERSLNDVCAMQSELALKIAANLQTKLSSKERVRVIEKPTENAEAYLIFMEAEDVSTRSGAPADHERAAALYRKALGLDPSFALGFAHLSYILGTLYQSQPSPRLGEEVYAAAREALRLQPELAEGHLALGYYYYRVRRDYEHALQELAIASRDLPNDSEVDLVLGSIRRRQGDWAGAIAAFEKATTLNPRGEFLWLNLGTTARAMRDFPAAAAAFAKGIESDPDYPMNRHFRALLDIEWKGDTQAMEQLLAGPAPAAPNLSRAALYARFQLAMLQRRFEEASRAIAESSLDGIYGFRSTIPVPRQFLLGKAYRKLNRGEEADAAFNEAAKILENLGDKETLEPWRLTLLGNTYAELGRADDAKRQAQQALELLPESRDAYDGPAILLEAAEIYCLANDRDEALRLLTHSLASNGGITVPMLKLDPRWDPLREDERFKKLVAETPVEVRTAAR